MKAPGREIAIAVVWLAVVGGGFAAFYFLAGPGAKRAPARAPERKAPPDCVWEKIRDRIIIGEKNAFRVIRIFKPAFAIPAIAIIMLIAVFVIRFPLVGRTALNTYITDQTEFIMDLGQNGIDVPDEGLGTSIEEFLLS